MVAQFKVKFKRPSTFKTPTLTPIHNRLAPNVRIVPSTHSPRSRPPRVPVKR
jgi:hypothetical protein